MAILIFVPILVMFLLIFLTQAIVVHAGFQAMRARRIDWAESIMIALRRFFPILGIMIIWVLVIFGLSTVILGTSGVLAYALSAPSFLSFVTTMVFLVAILFLLTMWFVALQACVVEKTGVFGSLRRSARLTKGNRLRLFGLFLTVMIVGVIVSIVLGALAGVAARLTGAAIVATVVAFGWQAFWSAYYAVAGVVAYHDLRVAKEGIDVDKIASVFD